MAQSRKSEGTSPAIDLPKAFPDVQEMDIEDIMPLNDLANKFESFNFHVIEISGHNFRQIDEAVEEAKTISTKPIVIIANTIPGKGVKEFERDYRWHGKAPNKEEADIALRELRTLGGKIKAEHQ
jgi:transketolase